MKIAVEGCCHGALDAIYRQIAHLEQQHSYKVDLLLICGDFQAIRNYRDLQCMAVPQKFRQLGEFYRYYTGEAIAPILTIVIGGNHEASNYMWELYHGGWLAPNIYFLGNAGCIQVNGIRIAGASGIWKPYNFRTGHWERLPYDNSALRSVYHTREFDVQRLSLLSSPNVFMSHDWPVGIEQHGDVNGLLRRKPFFREDIQSGKLGSPPMMGLLQNLKPQWWFAAHLHVKFVATVTHGVTISATTAPGGAGVSSNKVVNPDEIKIDFDTEDPKPEASSLPTAPKVPVNPDEILLDDQLDDVDVPQVSEIADKHQTQFIALDKCLPKRQFLEVVDIPARFDSASLSEPAPDSRVRLYYDPEWLAITRAFHPYMSTTKYQRPLPVEAEARAMVQKELDWVLQNVVDKDTTFKKVVECQVFHITAPGPGNEGDGKFQQPPWYTNPQTVAFCEMLGLENKVNPVPLGMQPPSASSPPSITPIDDQG